MTHHPFKTYPDNEFLRTALDNHGDFLFTTSCNWTLELRNTYMELLKGHNDKPLLEAIITLIGQEVQYEAIFNMNKEELFDDVRIGVDIPWYIAETEVVAVDVWKRPMDYAGRRDLAFAFKGHIHPATLTFRALKYPNEFNDRWANPHRTTTFKCQTHAQ